jgi:futalosine hydrolase
MRILLLAATQFEIEGFINPLPDQINLDVCITGVGPSFAMLNAMKFIADHPNVKYDYILQIGIAGCFETNITLGTVFNVLEDQFLVGAWENEELFNSVDEMGFNSAFRKSSRVKSFKTIELKSILRKCEGLTVSAIESNKARIKVLKSAFPEALIESMEGAVVFELSNYLQTPAISLKAVSNYVGERDKSKWDFKTSISNLHMATNDLLLTLNKNYNANR